MQAPRTRVPRRPVHGVLVLDKPLGWSSNQALQRVKWLLRAEKAGHTGTLDPLATGVLPLCFGAATKFSQMALDADKTYEACVCLGVTTTTADAEGEILSRAAGCATPAEVDAVLARFTGTISQIPPMYSALKHEGVALYEIARRGETVQREPREVTIRSIERLGDLRSGEGQTQLLNLRVSCSKGTYIRTLAEDIGQALGCGAHLAALRRTVTAGFGIGQAVTVPELEALDEPARLRRLLPVDSLLPSHQTVTLGDEDAGRFLSGLRRRIALPDAPLVRVTDSSPRPNVLGTAHLKAGELIAGRLLTPVEIRQIQEQNP